MKKRKENLEAIYRAASRTFGFARLNDGEEIYISSKDSMDAMNDDKVLIEITLDKSSDKKNRDRVSDIVVGYFEPSGGFGFVTPINKKVPFDIHIEKKYFGKAVKDSIVEVKILPKKHKNDNPEEKKCCI